MKNQILSSCLLLVVLILGCKKYPEGPKVSFRTPTNRITGDWNCTEYRVNGEDYLEPIFFSFTGKTGLPCAGFIPGTTVHKKSCSQYKEINSSVKFQFSKDGNLKETWKRDRFVLDEQKSIDRCECIYEEIVYAENNVYDEKWSFSSDKEKLTVELNGQREEFKILKLTNKEMVLYHPEENGNKETKISLEQK